MTTDDREPVLSPALCRRASERGFAVTNVGRLAPAELATITARLGPLMFTPGEVPHPDSEFVFVVTNRGRSDVPQSVFHSDTSYVAEPPSFTVLAAVDIPDAGGETLFVNQFEAWQSADEALRSRLRGVEFLHVASRVARPDEAGEGVWHPVVRLHPTIGKPALYVSARERLVQARRDGVVLSEADATALIDAAHALAMHGAPRRSHRWSAGDLLLTDNRSTLHAADHSAVVGERTLHRVMVRGERPVAVEG